MKNITVILQCILCLGFSKAQNINDVMTSNLETIMSNMEVHEDVIYIVRNKWSDNFYTNIETWIVTSDLEGNTLDSALITGVDSLRFVFTTEMVFSDSNIFLEQIISDEDVKTNYVRLITLEMDLQFQNDTLFPFENGHQIFKNKVSTTESTAYNDIELGDSTLLYCQIDSFKVLHLRTFDFDLHLLKYDSIDIDIVSNTNWMLYDDLIKKNGNAYLKVPIYVGDTQKTLEISLDAQMDLSFLEANPDLYLAPSMLGVLDDPNVMEDSSFLFVRKNFFFEPDSLIAYRILQGALGAVIEDLEILPGHIVYQSIGNSIYHPFHFKTTWDPENNRVSTMYAFEVEQEQLGPFINQIEIYTKDIYSEELEKFVFGGDIYTYPYSLEHASDGSVLLFTYEIVDWFTPEEQRRHRIYRIQPGIGGYSLVLEESAQDTKKNLLQISVQNQELNFLYSSMHEDSPKLVTIYTIDGKQVYSLDCEDKTCFTLKAPSNGIFILEVTTLKGEILRSSFLSN